MCDKSVRAYLWYGEKRDAYDKRKNIAEQND